MKNLKLIKMEKFKEKWSFDKNCVYSTKDGLQGNIVCESPIDFPGSMINWEANAKLIASAPLMLDEIYQTIIDLKILRNQIADANKTNHLFDGMPDLIKKWIDRKELIINKATE